MVGDESSAMGVVTQLLDKGLVVDVIGEIPQYGRGFGLVVWARKPPKDVFRAFIIVASLISAKPLKVYVDDIVPQLLLKRGWEEQKKLNKQYSRFFNLYGCKVSFSSQLFGKDFKKIGFMPFLKLAQKITLSQLVSCLPESKRKHLNQFDLGEIIHTLSELRLFEFAANSCDALLVGHHSQTIVALFEKVSERALPALVLPRFVLDEELNTYMTKLDKFASEVGISLPENLRQ